jgi:hypothetical protein
MNFAWHTDKPIQLGLRTAVVSPATPATTAVEFAELNGFDVLIVQGDDDTQQGLFLPAYLREHLPENSRLAHLALTGDLRSIVAMIDEAIADFHSENVNIHPKLRVCPVGPHLAASNPCMTHGMATQAY